MPAPAVVPRHGLGTGEQPAHLVVRSGVPACRSRTPGPRPSGTWSRPSPRRPRRRRRACSTRPSAPGTRPRCAGCTRSPWPSAGTLLDERVPSLTDARATEAQPGIALVDRPGADTGSPHRATLADVAAERGRPLGEGQYVVHDTDALRLPYLPDPFATGVSLVFYDSGAPHALPEPRALQAVQVPYPGTWPSLQPLRLVLEPGDTLDARAVGHEVRVTLPPGEQVRMAVSSTLSPGSLDRFGLWRSHLASVADPADGFTQDEVVASAALMRAAAHGLDLVAHPLDRRPAGARRAGPGAPARAARPVGPGPAARAGGAWRCPAWSTSTGPAPTPCS